MSDHPQKISVLFVCTGNICRSPTAEAVFRQQVEQAGLSHIISCDSAGTHGYHIGHPPDPRTVATALERGVDMKSLRARKAETADFTCFDYIFAMDSGHYTLLKGMKPGDGATLALFLGFSGADKAASRDVPDPYYGDQAGFEEVYDLVDAGCREILETLKARHGI